MNDHAAPSGPPAPRRRGARILAIAGGALALVLGLVVLAPTFVSWGLFRGTILGAVSGAVNGTVSVTSLDVGWFSGVDVRGFTIDDPSMGNRVQVDARVEQGVWHVLRSGLSGLDVHVSGAVKTRREADGTITLSRLARTAEDLPVLLLGADIPGLLPQHLAEAAAALTRHPAVIGPAADGGYWLLGLAVPMPALFRDVAWGTDSVLATTLARLPAETPRLETLSDLDTPDDLANWPGL